MLIFVILLHFGLKILSLSASTTDTTKTHVCADFSQNTNKTTIKWAVSSPVPVVVLDCELIFHEVGSVDPAQFVSLPAHGTYILDSVKGPVAWTIQVSCRIDDLDTVASSPSIKLIPENGGFAHVCSDSGLGSMVPGNTSDIPVVVCIWRPESNKNYSVVRWQPTFAASPFTSCALHHEVKGHLYRKTDLYIDDMQYYDLESNNFSAWVTCDTHGSTFSSGKAIYTDGTTTACSVDAPTEASSGTPTNSPSLDAPLHGKLGVTNMAMGLSLATGILIAAVILAIGFIRWFRWQRRRRRERLLRHGEPAADQSAMDEFQQMV